MAVFIADFQGNSNFNASMSGNASFGLGMSEVVRVLVNDYAELLNKPSINGTTLVGDVALSSLGLLAGQQLSTADWSVRTDYIPSAGEICIYTDYKTITDEQGNTKNVAGIKVGDGLAYVVDLPFVTSEVESTLTEHINDTIRHVNSLERATWNSKLGIAGVDDETLVLG